MSNTPGLTATKQAVIDELSDDGPLTREELNERIAGDRVDTARLELLDANRIYANADWEYDVR